MHSGLQEGGVPIKLGTQEHTACSFITRQILLDPQGEGLQGSSGPKIDDIEKKIIFEFYIYIIQSTNRYIPLLGRQERKAFPVIPGKQLHIGI